MKDNNQWKQISIFGICLLVIGIFLGQVVWGENGWNNFWDVFGSMLGVLGTYLVMRREVESAKRQHDEQIKLEKIHYNRQIISDQLDKILDLNSNRVLLARKIQALDTQPDEETVKELQSELSKLATEFWRVMRKNVMIWPVICDGDDARSKRELEDVKEIYNVLLVGLDSVTREDWNDLVSTKVDNSSNMKNFLEDSEASLTVAFYKMVE